MSILKMWKKKKITPFNNHSYTIKRETCEIITEPNPCNLVEYAQIHPSWLKILRIRSWRGANNNVRQNVTDEGRGEWDPQKVQQQKGLKGSFYVTFKKSFSACFGIFKKFWGHLGRNSPYSEANFNFNFLEV